LGKEDRVNSKKDFDAASPGAEEEDERDGSVRTNLSGNARKTKRATRGGDETDRLSALKTRFERLGGRAHENTWSKTRF